MKLIVSNLKSLRTQKIKRQYKSKNRLKIIFNLRMQKLQRKFKTLTNLRQTRRYNNNIDHTISTKINSCSALRKRENRNPKDRIISKIQTISGETYQEKTEYIRKIQMTRTHSLAVKLVGTLTLNLWTTTPSIRSRVANLMK